MKNRFTSFFSNIFEKLLGNPSTPPVSPYATPAPNKDMSLDELVDQYVASNPNVRRVDVPKQTPQPSPKSFTPPTRAVQASSQESAPISTMDQYIQENVFPVTRPAGIPDPVAAAMLAAESRGMLGLGARRNNPYNIGAYDSNPNNAYSFDNPQSGVQAFVDLLLSDPRYAKALEVKNDPYAMLKEIQNAGYAGDPATYQERSPNVYDSYYDFVTNTPEWRQYMNQ